MYILLIIVFLVLLVAGIYSFTRDTYRIVEIHELNGAGGEKSKYKVYQLHSIFGMNWWTLAESEGEFSSGSVFCNREEAEKYIKEQFVVTIKTTSIDII